VKAAFWHERWENNQLGFHQQEINGSLVEHWPALSLRANAPVFVPLCGKSLDMRWLHDAGHPVIGVEISPIACRNFFDEAGIPFTVDALPGGLECYAGENYQLYCGDLFALKAKHLAHVEAVFDRASLIALPPDTRKRYAQHMKAILPQDISILLITVEYDQSKMSGPPHSVPDAEVEALYADAFSLEVIATSGFVEAHPRFQERGLAKWKETVWRLDRGAAQP